MGRATSDGGVGLHYEEAGEGTPVLFVHEFAGDHRSWEPQVRALARRHRCVTFAARGYPPSDVPTDPAAYSQDLAVADALAVLDHLGIERAHVVGHSSSANIALQLALDTPSVVGSLALLETALLAVPTGPYGAQAMERYRAGDTHGAVDTWMRGVCGPDWRAVFDEVLPGAAEQAFADADTFLGQELPAVRSWSFGQEDAARVTQPALAVLGARTREVTPVFDQRHELLLAWLPEVEPFVLPDATHLLHVQNPRGMAEGLAAFFARHPL
jgi:pimeloyl-ACP methyl ester carboxylesterase